MFREIGVNFVETEETSKEGEEPREEGEEPREEADEEAESESGELVEIQQKDPAKSEAKEPTERTDDPVRMYLREMRPVKLLSREGEIAIAKRIEAGRELSLASQQSRLARIRDALLHKEPRGPATALGFSVFGSA